MPILRRAAAVLALALLGATGCTPAAASGAASPSPAGSAALVAEAEAFMSAYAADLRAGARDRVAERYDPRGAWFMGQGRKAFVSPDSIRARYRGRWTPPASFEWRDLSYEVVGPDAVVVTGLFFWGAGAGEPHRYSYTGLLLRRDGRLRIRLEDESGAPAPRPAAP
jgi:hypothetical protein